VLHQLSKYLYDHRQVNIPEVGTLKIVHQPASLATGDKMLHPPSYSLKFSNKSEGSATMQMGSLNSSAYYDETIEVLGKRLHERLQSDIVVWPGVGKMEHVNKKISFYPEPPVFPGLQAIPAHKVLRQNVAHPVLRGETEGLSSDEQKKGHEAKKISLVVIAGWIILFLAAAFITFYLYQHSFSPLSSGTQFKMVPKTTEPTHK
jgi:hypothetical protein